MAAECPICGSALFLFAPVLLELAFVTETGHGLGHAWLSHFGLYAMLGGMCFISRLQCGARMSDLTSLSIQR